MSPRTVYFLCIMPRFNSSYLDKANQLVNDEVLTTTKA